jgi:hypothetical protein
VVSSNDKDFSALLPSLRFRFVDLYGTEVSSPLSGLLLLCIHDCFSGVFLIFLLFVFWLRASLMARVATTIMYVVGEVGCN